MRWKLFRRRSEPMQEKRADAALERLKGDLERALGTGLKSLVVFGSHASGEFRVGRSDVNVLVVVDDIHWDNLQRLQAPLKAWAKAGHAPPVLLQENELSVYARALPIEFLDMRDHHRLLAGVDPFTNLALDSSHLRHQIEQELSVKQLKLRQVMAVSGDDQRVMRELLLGSLPSVLTLLRAVLRWKTGAAGLRKIDAADRLSELAGYEAAVLHRIHDQKIRRAEDELGHVARNYLDIMERVIKFLGTLP